MSAGLLNLLLRNARLRSRGPVQTVNLDQRLVLPERRQLLLRDASPTAPESR
jgi:hypothetical protein